MTTVNEPSVPARFSRQDGLAPHQILAQVRALVVGLGAVGRNVASQLTLMGVGKLTLIDHDAVDVVNLAPQGWRPDQLGLNKAEAAAEDCRRLNPDCVVETLPRRFARSDFRRTENAAVFSCVDGAPTEGRKAIWESCLKGGAGWFGDARAAGEVIRILACPGLYENHPYEKTLFSQNVAFQGACSSKMVTYGAATAASLLVSRFAQAIRGDRRKFSDHLYNILEDDITDLA